MMRKNKVMQKFLPIILFLGICIAQDTDVISVDKNLFNSDFKESLIQVGGIDEFILYFGYPIKKQTVLGKVIIPEGQLDEFVLDQGYPFKKETDLMGSSFKIIVDY